MSNYAAPYVFNQFPVIIPDPNLGYGKGVDDFMLEFADWMVLRGWTRDDIGSSTVLQSEEPFLPFSVALSLEGWTLKLVHPTLGDLKILIVDQLGSGPLNPPGY